MSSNNLNSPIKKCYEVCRLSYNSFNISYNNFLRKLNHSLEERFGKKSIKDLDDKTLINYIGKIHTSDLYLAMGMSSGNDKAWEIFEDNFSNKIHDFAMYYADDEDIAEEVFSFTKSSLFVKVKKTGKPKIDSFNGRGSLESWLKVIVYREVITHQKKRVKSVSLDNVVLGVEDNHEYDEEMKVISKIIYSGFKTLNKSDKKLLREYFILKYPERKIAENYQVHVSTISRRIQKVCSKLSKILFSLAKSDFNINERDAKDMFNKFGQSWYSNVAEILT